MTEPDDIALRLLRKISEEQSVMRHNGRSAISAHRNARQHDRHARRSTRMAGDIAGVHIRIDHRVFWPFGLA